MKVLWFSPTPCGSIKRFSQSPTLGSWMISLEDMLKQQKDVELYVAYLSVTKEPPFVFDGVTYLPIDDSSSRGFIRIVRRHIQISKIDKRIYDDSKRIINIVSPDIIHIHGTERCFGNVIGYAEENRIPVVFSIQGVLSSYKEFFYRGFKAHMLHRFESPLEILRGTGHKNEYRMFCRDANREMKYLSHSQYIIGRTHFDEMITLAFNPSRHYYSVNEVLRQPFFINEWKGSFFTQSPGKIKILSLVSCRPYKGIEMPLKAAILLKNHLNIDFEWNVIGIDPSSKYVKASEALTGINSEDVGVYYLGVKNAEEISEIMVYSDIFVQTSHIENSPNSLCEAMCIGMPIVASFAGGTSSLLEDGKEGLLYQDGDQYTLSGEILHILSNREYAISLGIAAKERARTRHCPENVVKELIDCYNEILDDWRIAGR